MTLDLARLRERCDSTTAQFSGLTSLHAYELRELLDRLELAEKVCDSCDTYKCMESDGTISVAVQKYSPEALQAWRALVKS